MTDYFYKKVQTFLIKHKENYLLRKLTVIDSKNHNSIEIKGNEYIDFSSNNYLGLTESVYLKNKSSEFTNIYGTGSGAARLLSGTLKCHLLLEEKLEKMFNKNALVFGNGFTANSTIIPAITDKNDLIISDKHCHASILHGISSSKASHIRFRHNDMEHFEQILKKNHNKYKNIFVITESLFSMFGDISDLKKFSEFKKIYNFFLYVDEAHAFGIYGDKGLGFCEEYNIINETDLILGTFGKAAGSYGAFCIVNESLKNYLINTCKGFIYSTSLPPSVIGASLAALELIELKPERRIQLKAISGFAREKVRILNLNTKTQSHIISIILDDPSSAIRISEHLKKKGFLTFPIRPPTAPEGKSLIRISLTSTHTEKNINDILNNIKDA